MTVPAFAINMLRMAVVLEDCYMMLARSDSVSVMNLPEFIFQLHMENCSVWQLPVPE